MNCGALGRRATALEAKRHHAARAVRHVLLRQLGVQIARQARVTHKADLGVRLQNLAAA